MSGTNLRSKDIKVNRKCSLPLRNTLSVGFRDVNRNVSRMWQVSSQARMSPKGEQEGFQEEVALEKKPRLGQMNEDGREF